MKIGNQSHAGPRQGQGQEDFKEAGTCTRCLAKGACGTLIAKMALILTHP